MQKTGSKPSRHQSQTDQRRPPSKTTKTTSINQNNAKKRTYQISRSFDVPNDNRTALILPGLVRMMSTNHLRLHRSVARITAVHFPEHHERSNKPHLLLLVSRETLEKKKQQKNEATAERSRTLENEPTLL